jgi:hypothetical protein
MTGVELARMGEADRIGLAFAFDARGPVVLRERFDGRVLLGAVVDAAGSVLEWLELAVQSASRLADSTLNVQASNQLLDDRWLAEVESLRRSGASIVSIAPTGYALDVLTLDRSRAKVQTPQGPSGAPLRLCRDESTLASAGLGAYVATLDRFLDDGAGTFVTVAGGRADGLAVRPEDLGITGPLLDAINLEGGIIYARRFLPLSYEATCDWLAGASPTSSLGSPEGRPWLDVSDVLSASLLAELGESARLLESLYLRLSMLVGAMTAVWRATESLKRPLLNVSSESFRVMLPDDAGPSLPARWAMRVELTDAGLALATGEQGLSGGFAPMVALDPSPYRSHALNRNARGSGNMQLRRIALESGDSAVLEARLITQQRVAPAAGDVIHLRFAIGSTPFDLQARVDPGVVAQPGEWRIRTIQQPLDGTRLDLLKRAQGQTVADVLYDLIPAISSPCDMHSLGVLAVRTLLVNLQRPLSVAMDDLGSLARRCASGSPGDLASLARAIEAELHSSTETSAALGPGNLAYDPSLSHAASIVPLGLWSQVLAATIALTPGLTPVSWCADAGAAPVSSPASIYPPAVEEFDRILRTVRSMLFCDWASNREIDAVIRELESSALSYSTTSTSQKGPR